MVPKYRLRLLFEWFGGCIWCGNEAARARFDVGPIEDLLPLSFLTRQRLEELSARHDQSLNPEYPPDPGPWTADQHVQFDLDARELLGIIQQELGPEFEVVYEPLGHSTTE